MDYLFLYLLGLTDLFIILRILFITLLVVVVVMTACFWYDNRYCIKANDDEEVISFFKTLKKWTIISAVCCMLSFFLPLKNTLILMGGLHYGKHVITNERIEKINKIIDLELDKRIDRLEVKESESK